MPAPQNGKIAGLCIAVALAMLATVVGALLLSWSSRTDALAKTVTVVQEEAGKQGNRLTKVETNIESIDKTLERVEGKLDKALER